jgi:hypothetical protein
MKMFELSDPAELPESCKELQFEIQKITKKIKKLKKENKKLAKALYFYGNPDTYFATLLVCDSPCGAIVKDSSGKRSKFSGKLGKRARRALKGKVDWDEKKFIKNK